MTASHYETLGVGKLATAEEIKAAYRRCSSKAHPDREGGSTERMAAVNRAYDVLSDPVKRARYDETGQDATMGKTVEQMAEELVASWIAAAFDKDEEPLAFTRDEITRQRMRLDTDRTNTLVDIKKLEKRIGKTRRKSQGEGRNLFEQILQSKLQQKRSLVERMEEALEAQEKALDLLDEYESLEPPPEPKDTRTALQKRQQRFAESMVDEILNGRPGASAFYGSRP